MGVGITTFAALLERYEKSVRGLAKQTDSQAGEWIALKRGARPSREQLKKLAPAFGMTEAELAIVLLTGETREAAPGADDHADH